MIRHAGFVSSAGIVLLMYSAGMVFGSAGMVSARLNGLHAFIRVEVFSFRVLLYTISDVIPHSLNTASQI